MPKYRRLKEVEQELGNLEKLILPLVNRGGQALAAEKLGVSQPTISKWLDENNYVSRTYWQKAITSQEES